VLQSVGFNLVSLRQCLLQHAKPVASCIMQSLLHNGIVQFRTASFQYASFTPKSAAHPWLCLSWLLAWSVFCCRWMKCFCCSTVPQLQLVLIDDRTGTEVARIDGPGSFSMKSSQHYSMTVRNSPGDQASDRCWVRLVIASGLLAVKYQKAKRQAGKTAAAFAYNNDISFEL